MTEYKWQNFAGYLNSCIHELHHPDCPFKQPRTMDQYEKLEYMKTVKEKEANKMMKSCLRMQSECFPVFNAKNKICLDMAALQY